MQKLTVRLNQQTKAARKGTSLTALGLGGCILGAIAVTLAWGDGGSNGNGVLFFYGMILLVVSSVVFVSGLVVLLVGIASSKVKG